MNKIIECVPNFSEGRDLPECSGYFADDHRNPPGMHFRPFGV